MLEEGPDGFMAAKPWAMNLIRELGLADQVIGSNDHSRVTYIVRRGKLVPMPEGLMMMVPTKILPLVETRLLSWGAKIRMGLEIFRQPPHGPQPDRSVYEFLLDHYGEESIDYLAEPLLAGVYGGDPRDMSVNSVLARFVEIEAKYGSLTRGVLATPRPKGAARFVLADAERRPRPIDRSLASQRRRCSSRRGNRASKRPQVSASARTAIGWKPSTS